MNSASEKFFARVVVGDESWHCWAWIGAKSKTGYGYLHPWPGRQELAHRFSYRLHNKHPIEPEVVMHLCHNPECSNPMHLVGGTQSENQSAMARAGRATRGERHHKSKLSEGQVSQIRSSNESGVSIARKFGVSESLVSLIRRRKLWSHV